MQRKKRWGWGGSPKTKRQARCEGRKGIKTKLPRLSSTGWRISWERRGRLFATQGGERGGRRYHEETKKCEPMVTEETELMGVARGQSKWGKREP